MRPTSLRFQAAVRTTHVIATDCVLRFPGDTREIRVPLEGGAVTIDRTAMIRRTGSAQIPWSLRLGLDLGLDLRTLPLGGYCSLFRGLHYPDGTNELVRLGVFRVESVSWKTSDEVASLELADRMAQVRDEPFLAPYTPASTISVQRQGLLHDDSPVITDLATTADLIVGMSVQGIAIPAGWRIQSIDSATQITLNGNVNVTGFKDARVTVGDPVITNISETWDLTPGMVLNTPNSADILPGTTIVAVESANSIRVDPGPVGSGDQPIGFVTPNPQTLTFGGGVRVADAAIQIVQDVFGTTIGYQKLWDPVAVLIDSSFSYNRAEAIQTLALAAGGEAYFDADGSFVFDRAAGQTAPVWTVDAGEQGNMISADESLNRTGVYNGVLMQGQNAASDPPVAALVVDDEPTSPTRWGGPFGKVARVESSSAVQTADQAQLAARTLLDKRLTLTRALSVGGAPNPALVAGDVITVVFPDGRQEDHVIDAVQIALTPQDAQTFTLRSVDPLAVATQPRRNVFYGDLAWKELVAA